MRGSRWLLAPAVGLAWPAIGLGLAAAPAAAATVCPAPPVALVNGSFEEPVIGTNFAQVDAADVPGWNTAAPDQPVELWRSGNGGVPAVDGNQLTELNARGPGALFQTLDTPPGAEMTFIVHHRGRGGTDVAAIEIGPEGGPPDRVVTMSDPNTAWVTHAGTYSVPPGQTRTTLTLRSVSQASRNPANGNLIDAVSFGTAGCLTADKTVVDAEDRDTSDVRVGDTLEYTVAVANPGSAPIAGPRITDTIPEELSYQPNSVRIVAGPNPGPRTDADDGDGVTVSGGTITVDVATGGPPVIVPGGSAELAFRAVPRPAAAGKSIANLVTVDYIEPRLLTARRAVSAVATIFVLAPAPPPTPAPTPTAPAASGPATPVRAQPGGPAGARVDPGPRLPATGIDLRWALLGAALPLLGGAGLVVGGRGLRGLRPGAGDGVPRGPVDRSARSQ